MNTYEGRVDVQDPGKKGRREGWQILVQERAREEEMEADGRREVYRGEKRKHKKERYHSRDRWQKAHLVGHWHCLVSTPRRSN